MPRPYRGPEGRLLEVATARGGRALDDVLEEGLYGAIKSESSGACGRRGVDRVLWEGLVVVINEERLGVVGGRLLVRARVVVGGRVVLFEREAKEGSMLP